MKSKQRIEAEAKHRESLLIVLDHVQRFFQENLRINTNDECRAARDYTYGRWPEEFCTINPVLAMPLRIVKPSWTLSTKSTQRRASL